VAKRDKHHQAHFIDKRLVRKEPLVVRHIRIFVAQAIGPTLSFGPYYGDHLFRDLVSHFAKYYT
jgi:hypothetical protein